MATIQRKLVHKQFNSPIGLYSAENVQETLDRELKALGAKGITIDEQVSKSYGGLANSAVLRAVEEEEQEMKCEKTCQRPSRSRQRYPEIKQQQEQEQSAKQRPLTPLHQQQLEQIKSEYLNQQQDITIDRDTVLKINRLATRRNLHKREHSWPPGADIVDNASEVNVVEGQRPQHVRSISQDNALQFDETVCKRHGINAIRDKFNNPTKVLPLTPSEIRLQRKEQRFDKPRQRNVDGKVNVTASSSLTKHTANKSILDVKQRKNSEGVEQKLKDNITDISTDEVKTYGGTDLNLGFVEPKRHFYEQLTSSNKRWLSYENIVDELGQNTKQEQLIKPLPSTKLARQTHSLERGRESKQFTTQNKLPPQKPRTPTHDVTALQRRTTQINSEIKISYDLKARQKNPLKDVENDLENVPLPDPPKNTIPVECIIPISREQGHQSKTSADMPAFPTSYDNSFIYLRSIDKQDNTLAYVPAAITVVPSPTQELLHKWRKNSQLQADILTEIPKNESLPTAPKSQSGKLKLKICKKPEEKQTYVTHLPSTPNGIQLTRQLSDSSKRKSQFSDITSSANNSQSGMTNLEPLTAPSGNVSTNNTTTNTILASNSVDQTHTDGHSDDEDFNDGYYKNYQQKSKGIYYTDGEYIYGPHNGDTSPVAHFHESNSHTNINANQLRASQPQTDRNAHQREEIAAMASKYDYFQQSISCHLKQIEAYIENAKIALKSACKMPISEQQSVVNVELWPHQANNQSEGSDNNPLKDVLRKLTAIIHDAKPLKEICPHRNDDGALWQNVPVENLPIVEQVLLDLSRLAAHLYAYERKDTTALQSIIKELPSTYSAEPASDSSLEKHALVATMEGIGKQRQEKENYNRNKNISQKPTAPTSIPSPPPPPPPPPQPQPNKTSFQLLLNKKKPDHVMDVIAGYEQLSTLRPVVITESPTQSIDTSATISASQPAANHPVKEYQQFEHQCQHQVFIGISKDEGKSNAVSGFISKRQHQEQLVGQVIDILDKPTALKNDDETIPVVCALNMKGNLNQQSTAVAAKATTTTIKDNTTLPTSMSASSETIREKDETTTTQKCSISETTLGSYDGTSAFELHHAIGNFVDKQFSNYDSKLTEQQTNYTTQLDINERVRRLKNKSNYNEECGKERETGHHSPPDTYQASYEVRSPYVTRRQISWEDIIEQPTTSDLVENETPLNTLRNKFEKSTEEEARNSTLRSKTVKPIELPTHSNQSQTSHLLQTAEDQTLEPIRKYPAAIIEPHLPTRVNSPFGLNAIEFSEQHTNYTILESEQMVDEVKHEELPSRKYPVLLNEYSTPKRSASPFGLNSVEVSNTKRTPSPLSAPGRSRAPIKCSNIIQTHRTRPSSASPSRHPLQKYSDQQTLRRSTTSTNVKATSTNPVKVKESSFRKYPVSLIEPFSQHVSTYGLNVIEADRKSRTPSPSVLIRKPIDTSRNKSRTPSPLKLNSSQIGIKTSCTDCTDKSTAKINMTDEAAHKNTYISAKKCDNNHLTYIPQMEGHNVGLLVRTTITLPPTIPAVICDSNMNNGKIDHNMCQNLTPKGNEATNKVLYYQQQQSKTSHNNIAEDDTDDADDGDDEMQPEFLDVKVTNKCTTGCSVTLTATPSIQQQLPYKIISSSEIAAASGMDNLFGVTTNTATATDTIASNHELMTSIEQRQQLQQQPQYPVCMTSELLSTPTTMSMAINRSFNNVSPRPYVTIEGYKRVAWPPPSEERVVREFTPQPLPQYQTAPSLYNQTQQQQKQHHPTSYQQPQEPHYQTAAVPATQSQYRAPSYDNYQQHQPPPPYTLQQQQQAYYPTSISAASQTQSPLQSQVSPYQASVSAQQQQYQPPPWVQQQQQQRAPAAIPPQVPAYHQIPLNQTQQQQQQQPSQNLYSTQTNQTYNFNSQPPLVQRSVSKDQPDNIQQQQQQQQHLPHDYRGGSPGIITLRKEAPVTQKPAPVYNSQPAAISLKGGINMRGDLKWPPPEYKEAAARENEERRQIAKGPACRPRKVQRDYSAFFAKNALSHNYPGYKVPPGTQHMMV